MVHFLPILRPHTDASLGDCSYLNTCHRMDSCRYMHWVLETPLADSVAQPAEREGHAADEGEVRQALDNRLGSQKPMLTCYS